MTTTKTLRCVECGSPVEREHEAYAFPVGGGWDGYQARCHDCDWCDPTIYTNKAVAQVEAARHRQETKPMSSDPNLTAGTGGLMTGPRRLGPLYLRRSWLGFTGCFALALALAGIGHWFWGVCLLIGLLPGFIDTALTERRCWRRWGHPRWGDR